MTFRITIDAFTHIPYASSELLHSCSDVDGRRQYHATGYEICLFYVCALSILACDCVPRSLGVLEICMKESKSTRSGRQSRLDGRSRLEARVLPLIVCIGL